MGEAQARERARLVKDTVVTKGLPEKVANLIPDTVVTVEDLDKWVADYADVFGAKAPGDEKPQGEATTPPGVSDQYRRLANAEQGGSAPTNLTDVQAALDKAETPEEVLAALGGVFR